MHSINLRQRRRKLQLLVVSTTLAMDGNSLILADSRGSDILARCKGLQSDITMLTAPIETDLPSDVAATLSAYSEMTWGDLDDVVKVGLLWAHGYVFSGGSNNGDKAGDAILKVYTRCSDDTATGVEMADVGVSYDDFTAQGRQCEASSCGSYHQATNTNCTTNVKSVIQCAVDGASTTLQTVTGVSFWASGKSSDAVPYPQVFQHNITVSDETETLQVLSIHMRNTDVGTSCGNTMDTIIPCFRLEDAVSASSLGFCKPTVNLSAVKSFLESMNSIQVTTQSTDNSLDGEDSMALILGVGGGLVVLLVVLIICCCCRKKKMQNAQRMSESTVIGTTLEQTQSQTTSATRSGLGFLIGRRHKNDDNDSEISSTAATNVNVQTNRGRRSSWYTVGNASNRESAAYGHRSSMAGTYMGAAGGKTVTEYCNESELLTEFMQNPEVIAKRIAFDELTFLRVLSKGAYGEVWLGQLETRYVAIKRLLPEKCQFTASLEQFAGEILLMCTLHHRNIVSFLGVSWNKLQNLCAVVEYMEAGDLDDVLKKNRDKFSWQREKIAIAMDIAEGLVYLHSLRPVVVHRDLKSKNVLLNQKFQAKLSDFGVSRKTHVNETMTSGVGTLLWTAPEIIEGKKYSEKADIYSLGVVLSEMDTCESPFCDVISDKGERLPGMQLAQLVRLGKIRVSLRPDCPSNLRKLVMECTQLDPDVRPSSMQVAFTLKSIIAPTLKASSMTTTSSSFSTISSCHTSTTGSQSSK